MLQRLCALETLLGNEAFAEEVDRRGLVTKAGRS